MNSVYHAGIPSSRCACPVLTGCLPAVGRGELHYRLLGLDHCQIALWIRPNQSRRPFRPICQGHLQLLGIGYDMAICHDAALRINNEAGPRTLCWEGIKEKIELDSSTRNVNHSVSRFIIDGSIIPLLLCEHSAKHLLCAEETYEKNKANNQKPSRYSF
jgi:hypothetical protein